MKDTKRIADEKRLTITLDRTLKIVAAEGELDVKTVATETLIGHNPATALESYWNDHIEEHCHSSLSAGKTFVREFEYLDQASITKFISITIEPQAADGFISGVYVHFEDITEKKRNNLKMNQQRRMQNLALLASNISDKINNPLARVLNQVGTLLMEDLKTMETKHLLHELENIQELVYSMSSVTIALQAFSTVCSDNFQQIDINSIVEKSVELSRLLKVNEHIDYRVHFEADIPAIRGNEITLEQCFVNIIKNALEAMPMGGRLEVRTTLENDFVLIIFKDNGMGIERKNLHKIFDPFFKTKNGQHSGLGMSVGYGIISSHDGWIDIQSRPDRGTQVTVFLPVKKTFNIDN
ncbi:hypothetical protein JW935_22275 [candidate division KSB1 bacterium]|nr:hypothetical protein [candidate division KSB1 bacterium]